jgi:predicted dehydrogenase
LSKLKAVVVGAGGMGHAWVDNLKKCEDIQTVGWVDIRPGAAAAGLEKQQVAGAKAYEDFGKALAEAKPDFVVDVTVPEAHHDITLQSLAAGVPVLGEKPMADSMARARAMVAASEKSGKLYMVSQSRRYDARALAFRQIIQEQVGQLGILNSDFYIRAHFGGFRDEMKSVLLLDMAIHTFDNARQISGADPVSVYCEEFNPAWSWYKGDASATAMFEMTGGLRYTYRGSWCAEGCNTSWESEWRAFGAKGGATWDGKNAPIAERVVGAEGFIRKVEPHAATLLPMPHGGIGGSLREFIHALKTGETPQGECHDNIKSLAMVFAAVESAASGKRVEVKPMDNG